MFKYWFTHFIFRFSNQIYADKISEVLDKKKSKKNDVTDDDDDGLYYVTMH